MDARTTFRTHTLDGAALFFQPSSGIHVRVATAATAHLRRTAPRVAMMGITNACNLACDFCSRPTDRGSAWTVATAAAALRGLADAGTLEVAYGGGEPFAFRGLAELVAELDATTALAQHVTTNGTLIDAAMWARFAGRFGQVRLSIYDARWTDAADVLAAHGQRWGANLLIDDGALATLPATLAALAARGAADVSLLSYVGPDRARHLDARGTARLAAIIADAPIPCRLSVCFGDRVPVPRLFDDGDCGAGHDFVSITSDRRVQACSFQDRSLPGATAAEILSAWRTMQPVLAAPSPRAGCARVRPMTPVAAPPIAIWQGFSGNNSGECVLVATFRAAAEAEAFLAELMPGWVPDGDYSPVWRELFVAEGVLGDVAARYDDDASPRELAAIGATVLATQYAAEDAFPELRALAWKRGARVAPGGIHLHGPLQLLGALGRRDAELPAELTAHAHGDATLLALPLAQRSLTDARDTLVDLAAGASLAVDLIEGELDAHAFTAAKQRLGVAPREVPRLWMTFWGRDDAARAAALARTMPDGRTTRAGSTVLVSPAPDRKRLGLLGFRAGATVNGFDGEALTVRAGLWSEDAIDRDQVERALASALTMPYAVAWPTTRQYRPGPTITATTTAPERLLVGLGRAAAQVGMALHLWAEEATPLHGQLHRLLTAVGRAP